MPKRPDLEAVHPLSSMQQGMLFHALYAPQSEIYVEQLGCTLRGALDIEAFHKAWKRVVERHPALRTAFAWKTVSKPVQAVFRSLDLPLLYEDWTDLPDSEIRQRIESFRAADRARGFDLTKPPLMRISLARLAGDAHAFTWTHHHLLIDGWSLAIVLGEALTCYDAFRRGIEPELAQVRPFSDYVRWLKRHDDMRDELFWRLMLHGITAPAEIAPLSGQNGAGDGRHAETRTVEVSLSAQETAALQGFARSHGLTLGTVLDGAWAILLHRYTGAADVLFGVTVSGRPAGLPGSERIVGVLINTVPVRASFRGNRPVTAWLRELQAQVAEATEYQHRPLIDIQGWSQVPRGQALFQSIVVFENYPSPAAVQQSGNGILVEDVALRSRTNYPLTVVAAPGKELALRINYDCGLFTIAAAERMPGHLRTILDEIATEPQRRPASIPCMTAAERNTLSEWNRTAAAIAPVRGAHELFEAQAARVPEAVAVEFQDQKTTYGELNGRANRIAQYLLRLGVGPEVLVAISIERSPDMVAAILGVLKAGGAYVPLDPAYPAERIAWCFADSSAAVLLDRERLDRDRRLIECEPDGNPGLTVHSDHLAYVIYTSGSTGRPKGVMLSHGGLVNVVLDSCEKYPVTSESRVFQFASPSFDVSVLDIFTTLASGGTLCLPAREELLDIAGLERRLADRRITIVHMPPSIINLLPEAELPELQTIAAGGEPCHAGLVRRWARGRRFLNSYGPTEITVCATLAVCPEDVAGDPPIGRPVANTRVYLLDESLEPVPVGVAGELYIGGAGLARGYLNRPGLTAERFVPDPFPGELGARLYRSGDLGRWREDGAIEFLGRKDEQVKLRGFRVELGEIEAVLAAHPGVREAAVAAIDEPPAGKRLAAWFVPAAGGAAASELQAYLRQKLPDYMVPAAWAAVETLPRLPNGKIDRRALVAAGAPRAESAAFVAPRTPAEEIVAGVWAEVLGVERAGSRDNFFDLGGHSLLATQVVSRLREAFGREVPLRWLFEKPTVAELAAAIEAAGGEAAAPPIVPVPRAGALPLSFAQERLWFLDQLAPASALYNNPALVRLRGRLDTAALARALNGVIARHEALRTVFETLDGRPSERILPELQLEVEVREASEAEAARQARAAALEPFDLERGPLVRARLWRVAENEHWLLLVLHHIICDGWSIGVLVGELAALYRAQPLAPLALQYADFAVWQRQWLSGAVLDAQLEYWKRRLAGAPPVLELPLDRPRPAVATFEGAREAFRVPAELAARLARLGRREGATLFMVLASAFAALLARYSGSGDLTIGAPIANRNRREIEPLIGFFVNTLALRVELGDDPAFTELLARVRETALGAYAHQDLPFETLVEALAPERNLSHAPLVQVMFVLNNAPRAALELPGLTLEALEPPAPAARFDLTLEMSEATDGGLAGSFEYNTALFESSTIRRLAAHFVELLRSAADNPEARVRALELFSAAERRQLLEDWNRTAAALPERTLAHELFEEQARLRPEALAVEFEDRRWSYAGLNRRANQLAHFLIGRGISPGALVAILLERSPEMIVSILAVLKAGAAYVPLDTSYPAERLRFMLEDAAAALTIDRGLLEREAQAIAEQPETNPARRASPEDLAYVIYTSGSTGVPKGAMLQHRGLVNLALWQRDAFAIRDGSRVLQFAPFSFDASVWETFMALANGGALILARQERLASIDELSSLLGSGTTTVTLPPSVLAVVPAGHFPQLRTVIAAGEACGRDLAGKWAPGRQFVNAYGPTETTVCASMAVCRAGDERAPSIGRGIANTRLYVLDRGKRPAPVGVAGELHVGGVSLARGYLGRPELTAARFIPDPFGPPGSRLYATGDLARWRPEGELEFLGRIDQQVKVRGYRIEPGEVEAALKRIAGIREAVVLARGQRLVAYLTGEGIPPAAELKQQLARTLPDYMVPAAFVVLEALPVSPSGKVDKNALPEPDQAARAERVYVPPRTPAEARIAEIWSGLLGKPVSATDHFFELGGHSLLATQAVSRLRQAFGIDLPLRALFEYPTVEELARKIDEMPKSEAPQPEMTRLARQPRKRSEFAGTAGAGR